MISVDIEVSRSKVKVKGKVSHPHLVQLITQPRFTPKASNMLGRYNVVLGEEMIPIDIQVSMSIVKVKGHITLLHLCKW